MVLFLLILSILSNFFVSVPSSVVSVPLWFHIDCKIGVSPILANQSF